MKFNLNVKNLIEYFDLKKSSKKGDAASIISVVGEDLGSAIFKHFLEKECNSKVTIFDDTPTTGKKKGRRLDRWILDEKGKNKILYQAEIKNWCARAIGGSDVALAIDAQKLSELIGRNWKHHCSDIDEEEENGINKVFVKMKMKNVPENKIGGKYNQEPLLIIWEAAHPEGKNQYWYRYRARKKYFDFDYCHVFSCSLYLRHLYAEKIKTVSLEMTNARRRLLDMDRLFPVSLGK